MLTLAGEGIELPVATEHNLNIDYRACRGAGVAEWFTPVTGNEVTTPAGHFNIFPVGSRFASPPDSRVTDWPRLMTALRATPARPRGGVESSAQLPQQLSAVRRHQFHCGHRRESGVDRNSASTRWKC